MTSYEHFAGVYDALMRATLGSEDPLANGARITGYLHRHRPGARSLLELGCGTGAVLAGVRGPRALTGVDRSAAMLARARERVPRARLVRADIAALALGERFDCVICVFDTLNHLAGLERWRALFDRAAEHLTPGGLFAFDVNTLGQLGRLAADGPWSIELPTATVTQSVQALCGDLHRWHVRIAQRAADGRIHRHHERIDEQGARLAWIEAALAPRFELLERAGEDGAPPSDASARAYYAYRRRP